MFDLNPSISQEGIYGLNQSISESDFKDIIKNKEHLNNTYFHFFDQRMAKNLNSLVKWSEGINQETVTRNRTMRPVTTATATTTTAAAVKMENISS